MNAREARLLLAQREFDEADREWAAAQMLAGQMYFRHAVTRLYFSAFHPAQGLPAAHGIEAATDEGVQRLIGLPFVVPGLLPKEAGRALSTVLARRHEAGYRLLVDIDRRTPRQRGGRAARRDGGMAVRQSGTRCIDRGLRLGRRGRILFAGNIRPA